MSWYKETERQNHASNAVQYWQQIAAWRQETNTRQWAKLGSICITNARLWQTWGKISLHGCIKTSIQRFPELRASRHPLDVQNFMPLDIPWMYLETNSSVYAVSTDA
jgi:hypothetical protein